MISTKPNTVYNLENRHGKKLSNPFQEYIEKKMNLMTLLNLIKQSKTILDYDKISFGKIILLVEDLEKYVNSTINELKPKSN